MRAASGLLLLCALMSSASPARSAPGEGSDPFPGVAAAYLLKIDGSAVWAHQPNRRLPVASLAKMMTALVALEDGRLNEIATVGETAAGETGTRVGLKRGDRMRVSDLVAATLLLSANDAARALADHLGGTEARFVERMNVRAAGLGMKDTRFANATGHHHPHLYSTARDLALLAEAAMADARFAALAATVRREIRTADGRRTFLLENRNEMVGRYPGAVGVKTGYTREAGPCLVAAARRGATRVLLVLLNAPNRWWDAVDMMDRAFSRAGETTAGGTR